MYLPFNHVVKCQCGSKVLRLHAVLCQDLGTNLKNIICPLYTHPDLKHIITVVICNT